MEFTSIASEFDALKLNFDTSKLKALKDLHETKEYSGKWGIDSITGKYTNNINKFASTMDKEVYKLNVFSKMVYQNMETKDHTIKALAVIKKECFNSVKVIVDNFISALPRMSEPLMETHYLELRELLQDFSFHFLDKDINLIVTGDTSNINSEIDIIMGSILDHAKNMTTLPRTNKAACRRRIMQCITELKDTLTEFTEYVEEADSVNSGVPLEYDSDRDEDDLPYTVKEAETAKRCISLWQVTDKVMRETLRILSDYAASNEESSSNNNTVQIVITKILEYFDHLRSNVTDLSAELFAPFEEEPISKYYNDLKQSLKNIITVLMETSDNISRTDSDEYHPLTSEDREKLIQIQTEIDLLSMSMDVVASLNNLSIN